MVLAGITLLGLLLLRPALGLALFWNLLIPIAPALIAVAPGLWRNICPMASVHMLPQTLGIARNIVMPQWGAATLGAAGIGLLFMVVPLRRIGLNLDGTLTALMLLAAACVAFTMGTLFEMRSGWCTSLCPIHPVERLYGTNPAFTFKNARCNLCELCSNPCPDSTPEMTPSQAAPTRLQRRLGDLLVGSFPGFVWGWYQAPDTALQDVGVRELLIAYGWPWGAALISFCVYGMIRRTWCDRRGTVAILDRLFAAAAISTYYWYRLPGLAFWLPDWFPALYHALTTTFFVWFFTLRSPKRSWLVRPITASKYWLTRFDIPGRTLIRVSASKP